MDIAATKEALEMSRSRNETLEVQLQNASSELEKIKSVRS